MSEATSRLISRDKANVRKSTRQRPLPPDVNARNLAIEKQRREALNQHYRDLARLVPATTSPRRTSKVSIVKETIRHVQQQRDLCVAAANDLQTLLAENSRLITEVNAQRSHLGGEMLKPMLVTEAMAQLMNIRDSACDESLRKFSGDWTYDSPESGIDSAVGSLVSDRTTEPQAVNHYPMTANLHPMQLSVQNYPVTIPDELHGTGLTLASGVHDLWNIPLSSESGFEPVQPLYSELSMHTHNPILEGYADNTMQPWYIGETTATYKDHFMEYPEYHQNPISSAQCMQHRSSGPSDHATRYPQ